MSVYVLLDRGEYDSRTVGVFSTQEKADECRSKYVTTEQELIVVEFLLDPMHDREHLFLVSMWRCGCVGHVHNYDAHRLNYLNTPKLVLDRKDLLLSAVVWADTAEEAVQMVNSARLELIESGEWPD